MTSYRTLITSAAASAIMLTLVTDAFADVTAEAVLEGLQRQFTLQGTELTADSAELRGNNIELSGVSLSAPNGNDEFKIDQVLLEDVTEAGNGAFVIGRVAVPSFNSEKDGFSWTFEGGTIEDYYLAGPDETDPVAKAGIVRAMSLGGIAVAKGGDTIFKLDGASIEMSPYQPGGKMAYDLKVKDFTIDFTKVEDAKAREAMTELGYGTLTGRMNGDASWDSGNGDLTMNQAIDIDNAATLNIGLAIGGYTPELIAALQQMRVQMTDQNQEATGLAMLGLMQQLQIGSLSIELVDDSATGKVLDFVGKQQGSNRESVVAMAKGALPFALAQLQNPEFAASTSAAVGAFLDKPGSLKVAASPASPVPVAQIMGAVMSAPQSIIGILGVTVTANQ